MVIKINYEELEYEVDYFKTKKESLEDLLNIVCLVQNNILETNSGEAIDKLCERIDAYKGNIATAIEAVNILYVETKDYLEEMESLVPATNRELPIRVDSSSVLKNIRDIRNDSIKDSWFDGDLKNAADVLKKDPYDVDFDPTEYNSEVYKHNKGILDDLAETINNSRALFENKIEEMEKHQRKLELFEECDSEYAQRLKERFKNVYLTNSSIKRQMDNSMDLFISYGIMGLTKEEQREVNERIEKQYKTFIILGWSENEIKVYLNELGSRISGSTSYEDIVKIIDKTNTEAKTIGSPLFTKMFEYKDVTQEGPRHKLSVLKSYYESGFPMDDKLDEKSKFYTLVNEAVVSSNIFSKDKLGLSPTPLQYFVSTKLNQMLNNSIINKYDGGNDGLEGMFANGWQISGYDDEVKDKDKAIAEIIRTSRYHEIGSTITLSDGKIYDPRYNVKILSSDKKFERIYNTELEIFLDEIYVKYPKAYESSGKTTNIATYNYGYDYKLDIDNEKNKHELVDVNPYNKWGNDYQNKLSGIELFNDRFVFVKLKVVHFNNKC